MSQLELIATSAVGLEAVVVRELRGLGLEGKPYHTGRVLFSGDLAAICRANLWLRTADRVLIRMATFPATDFGQLFDQTFALPWEQWIPVEGRFPVNGRSLKSQLSSVPACQKIVKKAVVEKLKSVYGCAWFKESEGEYGIEVSLLDDVATLTLDTTGPGLSKRGYRTLVGEAQLRETMAAALVLLSFWRPDRPLIDPFCGTGTIAIEAALIGRNIAPGLNRSFASEAWKAIPKELWDEARESARAAIQPALPIRIMGTDASDQALSLARIHAEQAGVAEDIHFQRRTFADLTSKQQYGCIITNPPYGERLGEPGEIEALYRQMPLVLRRLKTWSHYILTSHPEFEQLLGQPADRRRKLYNARIECTYFQFHGPRPPAAATPRATDDIDARVESADDIALDAEAELQGFDLPDGTARDAQSLETVAELPSDESGALEMAAEPAPAPPRREKRVIKPAFGGLAARAHEQAQDFHNRLVNRARHLRKWPTKRGITCFRLYDRDIPEIPLAIDRYEDCLHIAEYERPHDRSLAEHADWLDLMIATAAETLEVDPANVFFKRRERQRGIAQYEKVSDDSRQFVVHEGGLKFRVNLSDYLDTGLFLDHRNTRGMVRNEAAGKRFLNLFAYTGSFTVYAAAGDAEMTTTVDMSNTYLDWAQDNLRLNNLLGPQHNFVRDDAVAFVMNHRSGEFYDLAVVDPPTYSNSKRTEEDWDVARDHGPLLARLIELMRPNGVIYFSTNSRRFHLAEADLAAATIRDISKQTVPEDFRNERIHRCWKLVKKASP